MKFAPFIDGSYGVTLAFLLGICWLTISRYRRAVKRLRQIDARA